MNKVIPFTVFTLDRLHIPAPPADIFENLIGYSGEQRFVGFCYTGHTLSIEDGQLNEIGNRRPWSIWYRSMGVEILKRYCFGYEGRVPEHMLILDRVSRALYAGAVLVAQSALRQQIPRQQQTATRGVLLGENREDLVEALFCSTSTGNNNQGTAVNKIKKLEVWIAQRG